MEQAVGERFVCTGSQTAEDEERRRGGWRMALKRLFRYPTQLCLGTRLRCHSFRYCVIFLETSKTGVMTELPGSPLPGESFGTNNNPENATAKVRKQK